MDANKIMFYVHTLLILIVLRWSDANAQMNKSVIADEGDFSLKGTPV